MASNHGIEPFSFEPISSEGEDLSDGTWSGTDNEFELDINLVGLHFTSPVSGRSSWVVTSWCTCDTACDHCTNDNLRDKECMCCREWALINRRLTEELQCITNHPDIEILCLNTVVLTSMWPYIMSWLLSTFRDRFHKVYPRGLSNRWVDFTLVSLRKISDITLKQIRYLLIIGWDMIDLFRFFSIEYSELLLFNLNWITNRFFE